MLHLLRAKFLKGSEGCVHIGLFNILDRININFLLIVFYQYIQIKEREAYGVIGLLNKVSLGRVKGLYCLNKCLNWLKALNIYNICVDTLIISLFLFF